VSGEDDMEEVDKMPYDTGDMPETPPRPSDPLSHHVRLTEAQKKALAKIGISTVSDILYHVPVRHVDAGHASPIELAGEGERITVYGRIEKLATKKSFRGGIPMGEATLRDKSGVIKLVWFNQPYMAKMAVVGDFVRASGVMKKHSGLPTLQNPELEKIPSLPEDATSLFQEGGILPEDRFMPVYPETKGITSRWIYHTVRKLFAHGVLEQLEDPIPEHIRTRYHLPLLSTALVWLHTPRELTHATSAKKRFAFEEIFSIQLERQEARMRYALHPSFRITPDPVMLRDFTLRLGFTLSQAQERAIAVVLDDFARGEAMLRLLEGDVGSGKTAVAAVTAMATVATRPLGQDFGTLQVAYMCPTEILATQHFESFIRYFIGTGVTIGLMTGSGCRKFPSKVNPEGWTDVSRTQLLKWVESGEVAILIGTHALIQKGVKWKHLAYAIIDEQHRFGTKQRAALVQKEGTTATRAPHVLSMTATPIPRTLALTLYGDLDLTLLDQMPLGRKPVITEIVAPGKRDSIYRAVEEGLSQGRQAYVICPRIDEPDPDKEAAIVAKSVKEEATRLQDRVFPNRTIDILHSKMKQSEKDDAMELFSKGDTDILVATSVVEVGVNVPNATIILIEGAERFGLAQLHQLRGRVIRGTHQAYCFLFSETHSKKTFERLRALTQAKNGFELSEIDLALRGSGELGGGKQWGISDIGMEAIKNPKMVEAARTEARALLTEDISLSRYPYLRAYLALRKTTHLE
jgi:ATP-dependent DNA helicase RecG